ncbi:RING/U-box superfamily protein [Actinidia rufa]|uniref:RING-type E3 ubiquitin transferase n=1 Tax=Actinidia rufa TaxID=165716 RepID=A0A7J0E7S4_9ERIC|nr:RING/U-box superfamily protein [Actinidia rufa]
MTLQDSCSECIPETTPSGSRRWRMVFSDTESDGFDSLYGESEYGPFHNESDAISFSAYRGDSDVSVDGHSFLNTELFVHPDPGSDVDSDTDIDPMGAGLNQWNSDDHEEEEEDEEDTEWEEADTEENAAETSVGVHPRNLLDEPEVLLPFVGNSGDYLDARGFHELLERLAEADSSKREAPPAAVSFVNSLPSVVINEEHEKQDGLACAICKDFLSVGTVVNRLPCFHLYHPSCILPWLRARNSCPLCRYELPTDDKDYDKGKRHASSSLEINEIQRQGMNDDSSSDINDDSESRWNGAVRFCERGACHGELWKGECKRKMAFSCCCSHCQSCRNCSCFVVRQPSN